VERQLEWLSDGTLRVAGVDFQLSQSGVDFDGDGPGLKVLKRRSLVERFAALFAEVRPRNIVELGVHYGGSTALMFLLCRPRRLVAIDLQQAAPDLDRWLLDNDREGVVRPHYGVDQGDQRALHAIVDETFGDEPLDLIIDDASHLFGPTRAAFNVLFPRLRPGGAYVIEDWSWLHLLESEILTNPDLLARARNAADAGQPPPDTTSSPARLVIELMHASAGPTTAVHQLTVERYLAIALRGDAVLDAETFDLGDCYGYVGQTLAPRLPPSSSAD
jgi:predicted O-methyltransferase YrrM